MSRLKSYAVRSLHSRNAQKFYQSSKSFFAKLDNLASDDIVIASSSSAMPISSITQNLKGQHRCIIAHPANPHLIPCVELCPSENTSQKTIEKTQEILKHLELLL